MFFGVHTPFSAAVWMSRDITNFPYMGDFLSDPVLLWMKGCKRNSDGWRDHEQCVRYLSRKTWWHLTCHNRVSIYDHMYQKMYIHLLYFMVVSDPCQYRVIGKKISTLHSPGPRFFIKYQGMETWRGPSEALAFPQRLLPQWDGVAPWEHLILKGQKSSSEPTINVPRIVIL